MEIKITKKVDLRNGRTIYYDNFQEKLVYGKIYNDEKTRFKPFRFVINYDNNDIYDYFRDDEKDEEDFKITQKMRKEAEDVIIDSYISHLKSYDDCKSFYEICGETIKNYNEKIKNRYGFI